MFFEINTPRRTNMSNIICEVSNEQNGIFNELYKRFVLKKENFCIPKSIAQNIIFDETQRVSRSMVGQRDSQRVNVSKHMSYDTMYKLVNFATSLAISVLLKTEDQKSASGIFYKTKCTLNGAKIPSERDYTPCICSGIDSLVCNGYVLGLKCVEDIAYGVVCPVGSEKTWSGKLLPMEPKRVFILWDDNKQKEIDENRKHRQSELLNKHLKIVLNNQWITNDVVEWE